MTYPLRCRCGAIQGHVEAPRRAGRAVCYCRDCRAFARYLGEPDRILNESGGTDIVATLPQRVRFEQGVEQLRSMSMSPRGLLRWYAGCCRTPIGNTPRNPKLPYVGVIRSCLPGSAPDLDAAFGPAKMAVYTASATGRVRATPVATLFCVTKVMTQVLSARLTGRFRENPFFRSGTSEPISAPQTLTLEQRRSLQRESA